MRRVLGLSGALWLAPGLLGCDDEHADVELIEKTRVLTARVEVVGEPARVSPRPGEAVNVRFVVVAPEPDPTLAFSLASCVARESVSTLAECEGAELAQSSSLEPLPGLPAIQFEAPAESSGSAWLLVKGLICAAGSALGSDTDAACSDGSRAQAVSVDFPMDDGTAPNTNPTILSVSLDGAELPADTGTALDCAALPQIKAGSKDHPFRIELDPNSRDPLPVSSESDARQESLLVSYYVTRGKLDHAWSSIASTAASTNAATTWEAPGAREPLLARFVFVVRDGRGGSDFTERRVCVVP